MRRVGQILIVARKFCALEINYQLGLLSLKEARREAGPTMLDASED